MSVEGFLAYLSTYNDPGEGRNFINGIGAVDLYGMVRLYSFDQLEYLVIASVLGFVSTGFRLLESFDMESCLR